MRIVGYVETYTQSTLVGWAYSPDRPDERLVLLVESDGIPLAAGLANLDRQDVAAAGHGDGLCGFRIRVHLPPGQELRVREVSTGTIAFSYVGDADGGEGEEGTSSVSWGAVQGNVDNVLGAVIRGWCWHPGDPGTHVAVQAVVDGEVVASTMADQVRGDLINAGIGAGDHAFNLRMPYWCLDGKQRDVMVYAVGHGPIHEQPVPFQCFADGPLCLLEQIAADGTADTPDKITATSLLRSYLEQVQQYIPASIGFGHYPEWRLALAGMAPNDIPSNFAADRPGLDAAIQMFRTAAGMELFAVLDDGAVLYPGAFSRACAALEASNADILYGDADRPVENGLMPWFRPDWNYDLCLSQDYTRGLTLFRAEVLRQVGQCPSATLLRLRAMLRQGPKGRVHHLPEVLCQLTRAPGPDLAEHASLTVKEHLRIRGAIEARVSTIDYHEGLRRIAWPVPNEMPLVSLIIPTRDRLALVRAAVDSIKAKTVDSRYEIIIINNQSQEEETLEWLRSGELRGDFRVIPYDAPFNFSDMNNLAAEHAQGSILGFINNDVELISGDWLRVAVSHLSRPEVGAVGARLRFSNGMIQHAGVVIGTGGLAENIFQTVHVDDVGYFHRAKVAGNYSAVTAACLFCRRSDFMILGGFDSENLPIAFNDVDFCLRLRETGALIVWTPDIELYHHESLSRGRDNTPEKIARAMKEENYMRRRWKHVSMSDPYYNPNLNLDGSPFTGLAIPPRHAWRMGR